MVSSSKKLDWSRVVQNLRIALNVHILEAFRMTLVKNNRQNGERRKRSGYLGEKAEP